MTYIEQHPGAFVSDDAELGQIDAIIFDCDGVLVDVSRSYDLAIMQTTAYILKKFEGIESIKITPEIIGGFKDTGGFNDEVDVTYASILSLAAAQKLGKDPQAFIQNVIRNADRTGISSVEKFLDSTNADIAKIRNALGYPGPHATNPLYVTFDQIFYGPELYQKIFGTKSYFSEPGLIENDVVLITRDLLDVLCKRFGSRIAIVTGRGRESVSYSLEDLLGMFDVKNSVFLEDEPRELAKPNPESLLRSIRGLGSEHCLYVGDSMEDLLMARQACELGAKTTFCGIYGTAKNRQAKREFFESRGAPIILESINHISKTLNLV